jgi:chromosome segregation ATPase
MANNKYAGYTPKSSKQTREGGTTEIPNKLDKFNPFEFRKGMDYELTSIGCARLAESTLEEREKCTEVVLKNLEEHQSYYSALIQYTTGMNHAGQIDESSFKKYLETYTSSEGRGDGMICVKKERKDDKMSEPKYDKAEYTKEFKTDLLKEAIKKEVKKLTETFVEVDSPSDIKAANKETAAQEKEPSKKDMKGASKTSTVSIKSDIDAAKKELASLEKERSKHFATYEKGMKKAKNAKDADKRKDIEEETKSEYVKAVKQIQKNINDEKSKIKKLTDSLTDLSEESKKLRREVAKSMMERDTHLEILKIIKEAGVAMNEGSAGVVMYYEIAKTAYQEGFMAGLDKRQ